ncbi:MAG: Rrf2 family transcriptional regulator [Verrucomicrobiota bacterium]
MKSDYAIALHILGFLTACNGRPLSSDILASTYGTNPVVVRRILSKLKKSGLVNIQRGAGGGSVLGRDPESINLRQIYESVSDTTEFLPRCNREESPASVVVTDFLNELYLSAEEALLAKLEALNIAEMDEKLRPRILELLAFRET